MASISLADELYAEFENYISKSNYSVGIDASSDVRKLAESAAASVEKRRSENLTANEATNEEARAAFRRLAKEMIESAKSIEGYSEANPGVVGERTLRDAMLRLCPIWPIC